MISLRELTKRYGSTLAVDHLTVDVTPGHVTGFLGPNGSGKSTTMRLILGLDRPTAGRALLNGKPYPELRHPLWEVGALLDARAFHPGRSAYHHLLVDERRGTGAQIGAVDGHLDGAAVAGKGCQQNPRLLPASGQARSTNPLADHVSPGVPPRPP